MTKRVVGSLDRAVHLVGCAQADRDAGDDARCGPARALGGLGDPGHHVVGDRPLVGHPEHGAAGPLARDPQHHRTERGEQHRDRQVGDVERVVDAEAVVLDVDRTRAREHGVEHIEVVLDHLRRLLVGQPQHGVDDPVVRRTDTEAEATAARRLHRQRLLSERDRMARLQRHHRGAELDAARLATHERDRGHGVEVLRELGNPGGREARVVRGLGVVDHLVDLGAVATGLRPDHDADTHARRPTRSLDRRQSARGRAPCRGRTRRCGA